MNKHTEYLLMSLKVHTSASRPFADIALEFPVMLSATLRMIPFKYELHNLLLSYNALGFLTFRTRLSTAIFTNNFDYLDNVILDFIKSSKYSYGATPLTLTFSEETTLNFVELCNSFKGRPWDDIIDPFIDGLRDLLSSGFLTNVN